MANLKYINTKGETVKEGALDVAYQVNEDDAGAEVFVKNIKAAAEAQARREGEDPRIVTLENEAKENEAKPGLRTDAGALTSTPVTILAPAKAK